MIMVLIKVVAEHASASVRMSTAKRTARQDFSTTTMGVESVIAKTQIVLEHSASKNAKMGMKLMPMDVKLAFANAIQTNVPWSARMALIWIKTDVQHVSAEKKHVNQQNVQLSVKMGTSFILIGIGASSANAVAGSLNAAEHANMAITLIMMDAKFATARINLVVNSMMNF